jgi:hypothetical protein
MTTELSPEILETQESTLFSIDTGKTVWYIDYNDAEGIYKVFKDERFRVGRKSLGEALEYVFNTLGSTSLKLISNGKNSR